LAATNQRSRPGFQSFEVAYNNVIKSCNGCHAGMASEFVTVTKLSAAADQRKDLTRAGATM